MNFKGFYIKKSALIRCQWQHWGVCQGRPCVEQLGLNPSTDVLVAPGGAGICTTASRRPQAGAGGCSLKDAS